jgi:hypothetical protein
MSISKASRIFLGSTIRPSSSTLFRIPVDFIGHRSPFFVIFPYYIKGFSFCQDEI